MSDNLGGMCYFNGRMSRMASRMGTPYVEPYVRWCEWSENESRRKTTLFSSYSIIT